MSRERERSAKAERGPIDDRRAPAASQARRIASIDLLDESGELIIEHDGREYRLRLTKNGKLILTA